MTAPGVGRFPNRSGFVPNFEGVDSAVKNLIRLSIWKRARVVHIDQSAPLAGVRRAALREGKTVYVTIPGLRGERCFIELDPGRMGRRGTLTASLRGARMLGRPVAPSEMQPVDLLLVGSVAVTRQGARVGSGRGPLDLEYGVLRQSGRVRESTPIVTLVHPVQIVHERIPMRAHDVPVDFVVTPDHSLAAPNLYPRPRGILWSLLTPERVRRSPVLQRERLAAAARISPRQR
jgi:5-formyltetrahydrofolate cyclo-ligase